MPYPYQIGTTADQPFAPYHPKTVVRAGVLYDVAFGSTAIRIRKSTDAGQTWTALTNGPTLSGGFGHESVHMHDTGTVLVFGYSTGSDMCIVEFTPGADTWGTPITGGGTPTASTSTVSVNTTAQVAAWKRSDGSYVLVYNAEVTYISTQCLELRYRVYSGGSWGSSQVLMTPGNPENFGPICYALLGGALMASDTVRIAALAEEPSGGISIANSVAVRDILSDNSVANYRRLDHGFPRNTTNPRYGVWGQPARVKWGPLWYFAIPYGVTTFTDNLAGTRHRPAVIFIEESSNRVNDVWIHTDDRLRMPGNWQSVSITGDGTGTVWMVYASYNASSGDSEIKVTCSKGFHWTIPSTLFNATWASGAGPVNTLESQADGGTMRLVFHDGGSNTNKTWYWQDAATCSATGCSTGGGSQFNGAV